ncbi:uncharacterized protein LOC113794089 [Dermatophagoides pteronyssinus]|uniref:uncharacterized protein LOC113794089 n=1 Tax=Dermatophagoides pteronyssinus TaxID=6956 RepID=UPI003F669871
MSFQPNRTLLYGILIIWMIRIETVQMTTNSSQRDEICESLRQTDGGKLKILAVGKTSRRLLLITVDFHVYDVALDSMNSAMDKLYLGSKPRPLDEKYPKLSNNNSFKDIKNIIFNAFIMSDADADWICITTKSSSRKQGVNYDIDNSEVMTGWVYAGENPQVLISTSLPCQYYSLESYGSLVINRYECLTSHHVRDHPEIMPKYDNLAICYGQNETTITMEKIPHRRHDGGIHCRSGNAVNWPVLKGFVTGGKFYLFGEQNIYVFEEKVFLEQGQPYAVTKRSYDSFFNCPGVIPPGSFSKSYFYWIIAAIILLLLILSIILWCILVNHRRGQRIKSSLAHGKTGRSAIIGRSAINGPMSLSKMSTNIGTTRSGKSTVQVQKINRFSSKIISHASSVGSTNVTARTGINSSSPNQLKRLSTRIQSGSRRKSKLQSSRLH